MPDAKVVASPKGLLEENTGKTNEQGERVIDIVTVGLVFVQAQLTSWRSKKVLVDTHPHSETFVQLALEKIPDQPRMNDDAENGIDDNEEKVSKSEVRFIDATDVSSGGVSPVEVLNQLASDRTLTSLVRFFPMVTESALSPGGLSIAGGSPFANQLFVDGVRMTDPVDGRILVPINVDSIAELRLSSSGLDAEFGFLNGGRIDVTTFAGADEFHVDGSVWVSPAELALLDEADVTLQSRAEANLLVTGPIIRKKLWFLTSVSLKDVNADTPFNPESFSGIGQEPSARGVNLLGKLMYKPFSWQRFSLVINGDPQWASAILQDELVDESAERQRFSGGMASGLVSRTRLSDGMWWTTSLGYRANRKEFLPQSGSLDQPAHINAETGRITENDSLFSKDLRHRVEVNSSLSVRVPDLFGRHLFKAGAEAILHWNIYDENQTGGRTYIDRADGSPYLVSVLSGNQEKWTWGNQGSLFIQDRWQPFSSVTIRAGLRFDSARAYTDANVAGFEIFNFNTFSPRLGVAWDPFDDGTIVLRGGYFHYVDTGRLEFARSVGTEAVSDYYAYNDATGEYDVFVEQKTAGRSQVFSPGMEPPGVHELMLGGRFVAFSDAVFGTDLIYRRREKSFEDAGANLIWNENGSDVIGYTDGASAPVFELGTFEAAYSDYLAAVFTFQKRVDEDWSLMFNYTFSSLTGTSEGFPSSSLDNTRQAKYSLGPLVDDIRHNAQLHATYDFPLGVSVGISLLYLSGRPVAKRFYNSAFNDYTDLRAPRGTDPISLDDPNDDEDLRLPDQLTANVRLIWRLKKLTGQDLWLTVDVLNLFNQRAVIEVEERDLPSTAETRFMTPLRRAPPLRAQASLRFRF
ncbi:MAG: TonB-dependent receptor [Deltaproteobacteria bacterium]|nr:TonB-dependent receptor [Deltaproteobacteria bacterium]